MSADSSSSKAGVDLTPNRGHAFGVCFEGAALPGLVSGCGSHLPRTTVERLPAREIESRWSAASESRILFQRRTSEGESVIEVEHAPGVGYRVWAFRHGVHLVREDGRELASAPVDEPKWLARMLLVAQALPLVAALQGRELVHASAVSLGGRVYGLTAPSGTGKSSVATRLLGLGAEFFADDVLALELVDGEVMAHPGPRFASVHWHEFEALEPAARKRIGRPLGESDKLHFEPRGAPEPLPLGCLILLQRVTAGADVAIADATECTAELLGSAYLPYLDLPRRLLQQFEIAAAVSRSVRVIRVPIREGERSPEVAERIVNWMETVA